MFDDIDQIRKIRKKYNLQMYRSGIKTFRDMEKVEAGALSDGALDQKTKELIALGISISNACYG
ncbi:carboxymuconolactone decarboxylase family protein [Thermodesulfobacteriota bacterium]